MKRTFLAGLCLLILIGAAQAFGLGGLGKRFGKLGAPSGGPAVPQPNGDILLVDGASFILQTDGTSLICRAGGC